MKKLPYMQQLVIWRKRREQVLRLSKTMTFSQVGASLGISKQRVHQIVSKANAR